MTIQNSKFQIQNYSQGQSLFELVVAIGISALIIVVLVSLVSNALQNAAFAKNESLAGTYAEQTTEWLRAQRDADINGFITNATQLFGNTVCFSVLSWGSNAKCDTNQTITDSNGNPTIFYREITFKDASTSVGGVTKNIVEADVNVFWNDSKGLHQITNGTDFSDWRQR